MNKQTLISRINNAQLKAFLTKTKQINEIGYETYALRFGRIEEQIQTLFPDDLKNITVIFSGNENVTAGALEGLGRYLARVATVILHEDGETAAQEITENKNLNAAVEYTKAGNYKYAVNELMIAINAFTHSQDEKKAINENLIERFLEALGFFTPSFCRALQESRLALK
jgi:hypothetical protein